MDSLTRNWNSYQLKVNAQQQTVNLEFSDVETLAFYTTLQTGIFGGKSSIFSKQIFFEQFPQWAQSQWHHHEMLVGQYIQDNSKILDIGSGLGMVDLIQSKLNPSLKFYLVDKEVQNFSHDVYYSNDYPFYNNWGPTKDCINTSGLNPDNFSFLAPEDSWPEVDHIISYFSWCFHYPKSVYWDRVLNSLKMNGTLTLDVRLVEGDNTIDEISEAFKFTAIKDPIPNAIPTWIDNYPRVDSKIFGYRCHWKRCG